MMKKINERIDQLLAISNGDRQVAIKLYIDDIQAQSYWDFEDFLRWNHDVSGKNEEEKSFINEVKPYFR